MVKREKKHKINKKNISIFLFILSFIIVSFGQTVWLGWLGYFSAFLGYALFFKVLLDIKSKKKRFFLAFSWFFLVQLIGLSWMTSTRYVGVFMLFVYVLLAVLIGLQFALLSLFFPEKKRGKAKQISLSWRRIFLICSIWTIFEWSRIYFISGYSFNPIALALLNNRFSMQLTSIFGIFGLSFWVLLTNLIGYRALFIEKKKRYFNKTLWALVFIFPYFFGVFHENFQKRFHFNNDSIAVLLVQPAVYPHEKELNPKDYSQYISPYHQWIEILSIVQKQSHKKMDLVVMPEAAIPYGAYHPAYSIRDFINGWQYVFGNSNFDFLPPIQEPFAKKMKLGKNFIWHLTNAYWAQALSNYLNANVIIGLDDRDAEKKENYNSAFFFSPYKPSLRSYNKQILVPIVEYFPFGWCKKIASSYGICDFFTNGTEAKVFNSNLPAIGVSICYEETFGDLVRNFKKNGANILVNISNDAWFPSSRLPMLHYELGRVRSVENGLPILRSCNTGVTAAVDCFGQELGYIGEKSKATEGLKNSLLIDVPTNNYFTLYSLWGDKLTIYLCLFFIIIFIYDKKKKKFKRMK